MDHLAFELSRQSTYAKLSPEELESMGKQASSDYLSGGISLNEAVVKIAKQYPSISTHQVRRIVEFANQETYARLFEKQAGDKNVEFPVADPGEVLHNLDNGARPSLMMSDPPDYTVDPVAKTAASAVEADLALSRMFLGVDMATPGAEKTAAVLVKEASDGNLYLDRILGVAATPSADPIDRILKTASVSEEEARSIGDTLNVNFAEIPSDQFRRGVETEFKEHHTPEDPSTNVIDTPLEAGQIALGHLEEIPKDRPKTYYTELDRMEEKLKGAAMNFEAVPQRPPVQTQGVNVPQSNDHPEVAHQKNVRALDRRIEVEKKKQELAKTQFNTQKLLMSGGDPNAMRQQQQMAGQPGAQPAAAPQQAAPQQAAQPMAQPVQKMAADLTKQAMDYVKAGRPNSKEVLDDLRSSVTLGRIKMASASLRTDYPMANQHGDLFRTKQKVAKLMDDALHARDFNDEMAKQAQQEFEHHVMQFMRDGGNLGEVAHTMEIIGENSPGVLKEATTHMLDHLVKGGMMVDKTRAEMIAYEMTKKASRTLNPENPIVQSFSSFIKVAGNQSVLNKTYEDLQASYRELDETIKEVLRASPRQ